MAVVDATGLLPLKFKANFLVARALAVSGRATCSNPALSSGWVCPLCSGI